MPSPFPGMDPYLEQKVAFHDFHNAFAVEIRRQLGPMLRPDYFVTLDSHVYTEGDDGALEIIGASDLSVGPTAPDVVEGGGVATLAPPVRATVPMPAARQRDTFVEVRDRNDRRLVTVIEILSPANKKPGRDRDAYLAKRDEYLRSEAHLIEIDLLRGGPRMPIEGAPASDYLVLVSRAGLRPDVDLWPVQLDDPLPTVPLPLAGEDPDVPLDLQAAFSQTFEDGGYEDYVYRSPPTPPLEGDRKQWAEGLLAGRRQ